MFKNNKLKNKSPKQGLVERVKMPHEGEIFGVVESTLGSNKLKVRCQDDKIRNCRIPGKMRKKMWIREGDIVIVKPWDIQGETRGDILWRYTKTQAGWLKKNGALTLEL